MAKLLHFYRGAVTYGDYDAMPHGDLVALQDEMLRAMGGGLSDG